MGIFEDFKLHLPYYLVSFFPYHFQSHGVISREPHFSASNSRRPSIHLLRTMPAVLITGATGKQGGSLIRSLVARKSPLEILAVIRNPQSHSAQKLAKLSSNIRLVEGNLDDPAALFKTAQNLTQSAIWGVYSVQVSMQCQIYQRQFC